MAVGILISSDLMFISKVKEVAAAAQGEVKVVRSLEALEGAIAQAASPGAIMLDLEKSRIAIELLSEPIARFSHMGWRIVSFFSHVHEDLGEEATRLGLGEVMARSKFVRVLPSLFSNVE